MPRGLPVTGWQTKVVPSFGGGLDYTKHPFALQDDQWADCDGWWARRGVAEVANPFNGEFATLSGVSAASDKILGVFQNPFTQNGAVLAVYVNTTQLMRLFTVSGAGTVAEITAATAPVNARPGAKATAAFLGSKMYINFGWLSGAGTGFSMISWTGGATYALVSGSVAQLLFDHIAPFKSHLVGVPASVGNGATITAEFSRQWANSKVLNGDVWSPAISNDADFAYLDDVSDELLAALPIGSETLGLFTRRSIHALVSTGGIPAFTRRLLANGIGMLPIRLSLTDEDRTCFWGVTPLGPVFFSGDDLYLIANGGALQPIGTPILDYWQDKIRQPTVSQPSAAPFLWHEEKRLLIVPRPVYTAAENELLYYEPETGAWSKSILGALVTTVGPGTMHAHGFIHDAGGAGSGPQRRRHWIATARGIFDEDPTFSLGGGANKTVDTKDFTFGMDMVWIDRIKVDWEGVHTAATLEIFAAARDSLEESGQGLLESWRVPLTFASLGTITMGAELACRLRGKVIRFRFKNLTPPSGSAKARIRGFSFRWRPAGNRRTP